MSGGVVGGGGSGPGGTGRATGPAAGGRAGLFERALAGLAGEALAALAAARFLTALPLPGGRSGVPGPAVGGRSTAFFPLVGLAIGALLALVAALPLPAVPGAALVVAAWVAATGGLHEDGWMDSADAAFAPGGQARRREILGDPRVGAHGATAGGLLLLLRFGGAAASPAWGLVAAPLVGRWAMVLSLRLARPLRDSGLGATLGAGARPLAATGVAALCLVALALAARLLGGGSGPLPLAAAWAGGTLAALACGAFLHRRLGGLSGDGHGAVGVAAELGALYVALSAGGAA